jgi:hypothetical protein
VAPFDANGDQVESTTLLGETDEKGQRLCQKCSDYSQEADKVDDVGFVWFGTLSEEQRIRIEIKFLGEEPPTIH